MIEKVEGDDKKKETTMNEDDCKSVDTVSNSIESPYDKDGKAQYQCMSLNGGIYKNDVMIHLPQEDKRIVFIVMNFVLVLWMGVILMGLPSG